MRTLVACAAILVSFVTVAGATGASWPIIPAVDFSAAQTVGPGGARATIRITVHDDASEIDVEVYGLDGMRAGDDDPHQRVEPDGVCRIIPASRGGNDLAAVAEARVDRSISVQ